MCQTLFHIPLALFGKPLFGAGLLLAAWLIGSAIFLGYLFYRDGAKADLWSYVPLMALVAVIIVLLLPALCDQQGLPIRGYGMMMLTAVVSATGLAIWRGRRVGVIPDTILTLAFWMFVPGILGARLFYLVEYWRGYWQIYQEEGFSHALGAVINVSQGGLVVYGAFCGGVLGLLLFVRKYRLPLLPLCDLIAPSMMLGLALGRVGCLLNGCCYGGLCDHSWAITFPEFSDNSVPAHYSPPYASQVERGQFYGFVLLNTGKDEAGQPRWTIRSVRPQSAAAEAGLQPGDRVLGIGGSSIERMEQLKTNPSETIRDAFRDQQPLTLQLADGKEVRLPALAAPPRSLPVHPTQIYSTIDALLLCLLLLAYDPFKRREGALFALMATIYPITRFMVEMIRTDELPVFGTGMTISQNVSLLILLLAMGLWYYIVTRGVGRALGTQVAAG